jgi:hypothetical protein
MLQASLFTLIPGNEEATYEAVYGGGKCHDGNIGLFMFAVLLSQLPGKLELYGEKINRVFVELFNYDYMFEHKPSGIKLEQQKNGYGYNVNLTLPALDGRKFKIALSDVSNFAFKSGVNHPIELIANEMLGGPSYTVEYISSLLSDIAVFQDGQIFVDLGGVLEKAKISEEVVEFFKNLFKVNEFKLLDTKMQQLNQDAPEDATSDHGMEPPSLSNLPIRKDKPNPFKNHEFDGAERRLGFFNDFSRLSGPNSSEYWSILSHKI